MRVFKGFAASIIGAAVLASGSAFAQDMSQPANWAGFYAGVEAGYGFGTAEWRNEPVGVPINADLDGVFGGVQGGYNFQHGNFVFGPSAAFLLSGIEGNGIYRAPPFFGATIRQDRTSNLEWLGLLNAKAGYDFNGWLPYVTGGLAIGQVKGTSGAFNETTGTAFGTTESSRETHLGFNIGAGLETKITSNLSLGAEYKYVDLGQSTYTFPTQASRKVSVHTNLFSLKLSYSFN
ncbi:outer membrane protein [uncultured Roseibium sp.]|uniref:outer membrane protein n=1 Tax=uncultured Roseibium sp. TaxID=1936171 RepID=UPI003216EC16